MGAIVAQKGSIATKMIQLIIDSRGGALYERVCSIRLCDAPITIERKSIELGDIHIIIHGDGQVLRTLIFERKTLPDMVASITDGRYREQKARLLSNVESRNIVYIVEGDTICASLKRGAKNISSAYFNMLFRDDIHPLFTHDVGDTAQLITALCIKIIEKPSNYLLSSTSSSASATPKDYTQCIKLKSKKNHNIIPQNCFVLQLSQKPTISNVIAKNVIAVYPSVAALVAAMAMCSTTPEKIKMLAAISKVGKAKAAKLVEYMHL